MRFAFVADVDNWALHRQGMGLVRYGEVDGHTWNLFHARPQDFAPERLDTYDAVRIGASGLLEHGALHGWLPRTAPMVCSLASFSDAEGSRRFIQHQLARIRAFAVVDARLVEQATQYGRPAIHVSDRCDPLVYYPQKRARPTPDPLRVGWAGSQEYWPGIKHVDEIAEACSRAGVVFVRQDRELDGTKNQDEMRAWYNSLDVYVAANNVDTPTPVPCLEAASCGIYVLTTRCGELWPAIAANDPSAIVESSTVEAITEALVRLVALGRGQLRERGMRLLADHKPALHWGLGEAQQFTRALAALMGGC